MKSIRAEIITLYFDVTEQNSKLDAKKAKLLKEGYNELESQKATENIKGYIRLQKQERPVEFKL